jgi:two-component system sensor histidine kinase KdpD
MSQGRPDPDTLLRRVAGEQARGGRGRLKVFFGASPGVGKTYAMLEAARKARATGAGVVIGWVETHGRAETAALAEDILRLPPRDVEYSGVSLREFDLDAALDRRPALLLLDELAHTNAPGSRHAKRWQDAQELLDAGIDVYTTLNVQHVESLNDLVNQITGVAVRETIPDHVLDEADEVEFVDLPPEELLERLAEGKVYLPDQAARAAREFFRRGNLIALRELALRRTAEHVEADMADYRRDHAIDRTWPVAERILVCVRPHPESPRLVRAARRMAASLRAEWIVVNVESPSQPALSAEERQALAVTMKLAEELGADTKTLSGENVGATLAGYARDRNVSKIVVGKPAHARWRDRVRGSLLDDIVRQSGEIDVYFIAGDKPQAAAVRPTPSPRRRSPLRSYLWAVIVVVLTSLVCQAMFGRFDNSNLIMVYLLGICFVAVRYGRGPSLIAACLSVAAFDFFFVPPYWTFAVSDTQYLLTFGVMLIVALLIGTLAVRVRDQAEAARRREHRTQVLYSVNREMAGLRTPAEIARLTSRHVTEVVRGPAVLLLPGPERTLIASPPDVPGIAADSRDSSVAQWVFDHGQRAGKGTDTLPGASAMYLPLRSGERTLGVLALRPDVSVLPLSPDQLDLVETVTAQAAAALDRARLATEGEEARVTAERERLRSTLLSSVSHDLRTPLAAITGAASGLLQAPTPEAPERRELAATIYEEAERLNRLVANLLDMTRLESATVPLKREWHSIEEILGSALGRLDEALAGRPVDTVMRPDLPLVPMDAVLVEQVLVNLLENAIKYTDPGSRLRVSARPEEGGVGVEVADEGPGLNPGDEERVFEKFYRGSSAPRGFGLGLAICRAIVTAHGGRIWAENRTPRGVAFRFTLPVEGTPPPPPVSEAVGEHQPS